MGLKGAPYLLEIRISHIQALMHLAVDRHTSTGRGLIRFPVDGHWFFARVMFSDPLAPRSWLEASSTTMSHLSYRKLSYKPGLPTRLFPKRNEGCNCKLRSNSAPRLAPKPRRLATVMLHPSSHCPQLPCRLYGQWASLVYLLVSVSTYMKDVCL